MAQIFFNGFYQIKFQIKVCNTFFNRWTDLPFKLYLNKYYLFAQKKNKLQIQERFHYKPDNYQSNCPCLEYIFCLNINCNISLFTN